MFLSCPSPHHGRCEELSYANSWHISCVKAFIINTEVVSEALQTKKVSDSSNTDSFPATASAPFSSLHYQPSIHLCIHPSILTSSPPCQSSGSCLSAQHVCEPSACARVSVCVRVRVYVEACQGQRLYVMAASCLQIHVIDWMHVPVHYS